MHDLILSCDWGTSSFRLKLVDINNQNVLGEINSPEGIAETYNRWKGIERSQPGSRLQFYQQQLKLRVNDLENKLSASLNHIPMVISGMASSSIGMMDLSYANLPFHKNGKNAIVEKIYSNHEFSHEIYLISGVRNEHDVMRGEETQFVGLMDQIIENEEEIIYIFPGTHSKHLFVKNNSICGFKTYMTGEVFSLMSNFSILKDTIEKPNQNILNEEELKGFKIGIKYAKDSDLLNSLFSVRVNLLFNKLNKNQNYYYLSGLIIGNELKNLDKINFSKIVLCSGSNIYELYKLAILELGLSAKTTFISPEIMDKAAIAGQIQIFLSHTKGRKYGK